MKNTENAKVGGGCEERIAGMLGLAIRAGKLIVGTDPICDMMKRGRRGTVFISESASENTVRRIKNCCEQTGTEMFTIPIDRDKLGHSIGKDAVIAAVAVTDINMAKAIRNILKEGA